MSGICGIVQFDGAPVERELLERLTRSMTFRGPDAQETWLNGPVGFGHTLLRTTFESAKERQPHSLDGRVWITADARVDGRADLVRLLAGSGRTPSPEATDPELILHAYSAWGEACVDHLLGDFVFAIWDGARQKLFCARDHLGIKPFFFARMGEALVFSNTLECVRLHPGVSSDLNELAIADFLLFEDYQDPWVTAFSDVQRLPASHTATFNREGMTTRRYWTLPTDPEILRCSKRECLERFSVLLEASVSDRLRCTHVGIKMSGGLDSPAIAVIARDQLAQCGGSFDIRAQTIVYDRLFLDEERRFAGIAAEHLKLPIEFVPADDFTLFQGREQGIKQSPEPVNESNYSFALQAELASRATAHHRVCLTGFDGDTLLSESPRPWFNQLFARRQIGRLGLGLLGYMITEPMVIPRNLGRRLGLQRSLQPQASPAYPEWLAPDFEKRHALRARWDQVTCKSRDAPAHPIRPVAHRCLNDLIRSSQFSDKRDPGSTRVPLEYRHPMLDVRLVEFCLALPPYPWCMKKQILRQAMVGRLPKPILNRPKTPLAGFPYVELLNSPHAKWVDGFVAHPELLRFIEPSCIPQSWNEADYYKSWVNLRPLSLDFWLRERRGVSS